MSNYTRTIVYVSEGNANGAALGQYLLTRTRASEGIQFHPLEGFIKVINAQNIATPAVVNIGTNSPNFNNIVSGLSLSGPARTFRIPDAALAQLNQLPVDTDIQINVVTAATGAGPILTFRAGIEGIEV